MQHELMSLPSFLTLLGLEALEGPHGLCGQCFGVDKEQHPASDAEFMER